jgi:hypothetical protein
MKDEIRKNLIDILQTAEEIQIFTRNIDLKSYQESPIIQRTVEGIAPRVFFKFYGNLMLKLSKPADLIDLSETSKFAAIVKREGIPIYG